MPSPLMASSKPLLADVLNIGVQGADDTDLGLAAHVLLHVVEEVGAISAPALAVIDADLRFLRSIGKDCINGDNGNTGVRSLFDAPA